ncbi:TetR/AcrR family transcriptional regulator [Paracoccus denitrificans]|uniref:TetR/AcrR family transcriptional regulator n=1 Tax=Paracoccus denitrificans TaxID=266 RepID=UPI000CEC0844|nr:TetR/AcrR family transcriptional regulator [Paracoccus denitrificans]
MTTEASQNSRRQPRGPVQARSQKRIDAALAAAEKLLVELGPDKTSIPEIAARADVPRTTIYQYFPDKYALFAHMAESQYGRIADAIGVATAGAQDADWRELVRIVVDAVADFYNTNEVAAILLLMGPFGSADSAAHARKDKGLADLFRARLGLDAPADTPDRINLAIQIAFACLRWGYLQDGFLSPAIRAEAVRATTAYIAPFVTGKSQTDHSSGGEKS